MKSECCCSASFNMIRYIRWCVLIGRSTYNMYVCTYRYARGVVISNNEMHRIGDTGVVVVGDLKYDTKTPWIHVDGNYPVGTVVENNFIHELGVFTKQTAGFFQALAAQSTVRSNIIINGPRSAINFNDAAFVRPCHLIIIHVYNIIYYIIILDYILI